MLGGRGLLDHLLMTALHRAVALEQVEDVALLVGRDLNLDVATVLDESLHKHVVVTKGSLCFAAGGGQGDDELALVCN